MIKKMLMVFLLVLISGCQNNVLPNDIKCTAVGCSGQVCVTEEEAKDLITTCEYREEYKCLKFTNCGNYGNGNKCQWEQNDAYLKCLKEVSG